MEFLLNISIRFTRDEDGETRDRLISEEHVAATALKDQGHLVRIWRTPGKFGNWSLWRAEDATQLHEVISSLPLYPWMEVDVHALAKHPLDPAGADGETP